jgi:hypothetical protein
MKRIATQFAVPAACAVAAAVLLATLALASPAFAAAGDPAHASMAGTGSAQVMVAQAAAPAATRPVSGPARATKVSRADRVEARIAMLHAKLVITSAQEELWKDVTQVMRENAHTMEALSMARAARARTMTAVDDLNSYSEIAEAHAAGLKKFVPVFQTLYASMSDAQKAQADTLFRGHHRSRTAAKKTTRSAPGASTTAPAPKSK